MRQSSLAVLLIVTGCQNGAPLEFGNGYEEGDPEYAGQQLFLTSAWGVEVLDHWPPAVFMLDLMDREPEVFGDQFQKFGFTPDPADDFPIGFKRGLKDPEKMNETCAMCHVSRLPDGRLWLGLPAVGLDVQRFRAEVDARWVAAGNASLIGEVERTKLLSYGPGRFAAESGEYRYPVPADFPPYFTLADRTHLNYMGTGQNVRTEAFFAIYTFGAGYPNAMEARVKFPSEETLGEFLTFFGSLAAPPAPAVDSALAERGRQVFEAAQCGTCHHVGDIALDGVVALDTSTTARERLPGEDPDYPRGSITTSRAHRILQDGDPEEPGSGPIDDERLGDLIQLIFDNQLAVRRTDGYRVSDLRGLALTAPYLHNGSVPTLEALLEPAAERPVKWMRGDFEVDTTARGSSNEGHEFGSDLPGEDKVALIEYLHSLE